MLPSSKRLTIPLFKNVIDKGKIFHSPIFIARLVKVDGTSRFSLAVPKKIAKKAVDRNRIRRRVYSALQSLHSRLPSGIHGVFIIKSAILKSSFSDIVGTLRSFFVKNGLLK